MVHPTPGTKTARDISRSVSMYDSMSMTIPSHTYRSNKEPSMYPGGCSPIKKKRIIKRLTSTLAQKKLKETTSSSKDDDSFFRGGPVVD